MQQDPMEAARASAEAAAGKADGPGPHRGEADRRASGTLLTKVSGRFPSVTTAIRLDHTHVLALFRRLRPDTSLARKRAIVANACLALEIHAQLEEEIFYPALRAVPELRETIDQSLSDHDAARRQLAALRSLNPEHEAYDSAFRELIREVLHHVADEETVLLPAAEKWLAADLGRLGAQMMRRRLELLRPRAQQVIGTTIVSFPWLSAGLVVALGVGLWVLAGPVRSGRLSSGTGVLDRLAAL